METSQELLVKDFAQNVWKLVKVSDLLNMFSKVMPAETQTAFIKACSEMKDNVAYTVDCGMMTTIWCMTSGSTQATEQEYLML